MLSDAEGPVTVDDEFRVFVDFIEPQGFHQLQLRRYCTRVTWEDRETGHGWVTVYSVYIQVSDDR